MKTAWDRLHGDGEGIWLISYSDMMTLLLAFFTLLLSMAKVQRHRFEAVSAAFSHGKTELARLERTVDAWVRDAGLGSTIRADLGPDGLRVQVTNALLFASGSAELTPEGAQIIDRFLALLSSLDPSYRISIAGHSDDVPIHSELFRSNWELSSARAMDVLRRFVDHGIAEQRLSVQAHAHTQPADRGPIPSGLSPAARLDYTRSLDRRVVIVVH